ncbi:MAG: MttB6 [Candidatus Collierbacteria bacterium GW2011_GWB1_44_6]|uniref:MttB6 n=2 Tax=Candidatus Collieribacteriota TaxID=1752725 RepID=A0A0G1MMK9_9BACT|nr:MAG: MttB6 [Candidatus Collierbacteria bacterium GW2011_GWC2_43_12]KKT73229.1 MAG: MttB6 [Candidatus Collierbacteria bacterium GW2011_GWB1_44_6]KKT83515.1 MAG: MttB6 [Microgenomates group bacterium GW2011_GWC1_44_9]
MQPKLTLLSDVLVERVICEALDLLLKPGIKVQNPEARELLSQSGAVVDETSQVAFIPSMLVQDAIDTVPTSFYLYDLAGNPTVHYGGEDVHFDPGSSGTNILDPETLEHRPSETADLLRIIKVAEGLPQYDAQSTAVVCSEVPKEIQDLYRLYLVLLHSRKPIVTGAFSNKTIGAMLEMLALMAGSEKNSRRYPRAVFDVCPSPPLIWSNFGAGNLIALARAGVPAEMVSMPLAGAAAPVTLIGSVVQHAAECLSGLVIHQLAYPGSPIVWGGAPAIMDMRKGGTPMGAIETAMIDCSYAQIGKYLGLPTHAYLGGSDAMSVDYQAGLEAMSILVAALSGINMISGAGMIESLLCQSPEKLCLDAEAISMAKRMLSGIGTPTDTLATGFYEGIDFKGGGFLKQKITMQLLRTEQSFPGPTINRDSIRGWKASGSLDAFGHAKLQVKQLLADYRRPVLDSALEDELTLMISLLASSAGMDHLPELT